MSRVFNFGDTRVEMESKYFKRGAWPSWEWHFNNVRTDLLPRYNHFKNERRNQTSGIPDFNRRRNFKKLDSLANPNNRKP